MQESLYFHALNSIPGVGTKTIRQVVGVFGSARGAWEAPAEAWAALPDIGAKTVADFTATRSAFDMNTAGASLEREGIQIISFLDDDYPALLHETPHPPALLYVRGDAGAWQNHPTIAIVGSRKHSAYGRQVAEELGKALAQAGFTVVSGLAFGIDGIAHEAALEAEGRTVAILGSGIDDRTLSPQSHRDLARRILDSGGAILSELAPGVPGNTGTFPARNRIMAGMTLGTVVIEAAQDSGSLITARLALDYNREVFAVPGSIFSPVSTGTHALIRAGAKIVTGIQDILEELAPHLPEVADPEQQAVLETLTDEERSLYALLSHEPLHIDKIIEASRLETMSVNTLITRLEMRGMVKNIGNMHYIKVRT